MNGDENTPISFSLARRWSALLNLLVTLAAMLALIGMVNYLGMRHFARGDWTRNAETELSKRTRHILAGLTNSVEVIAYYDTEEALFPRIRALLKEYETASGNRVRVQYVDYNRQPTQAKAVKLKYQLPTAGDNDVVIFDSGTRRHVVYGKNLSDYDYSTLLAGKTNVYRTHFKGELLFTSAIFAVSSQRSPKAYFLIDHGEYSGADPNRQEGYSTFASLLQNENNFELQALSFITEKKVPADCSLLIVPGPVQVFTDAELDYIQHYLEQGGRLLVMFDVREIANHRDCRLEKLLAGWGVEVGHNIVLDPENATDAQGGDPMPPFPGSHPIVNSLGNSRVHLIYPRSIHAARNSSSRREDAKVDELLFTGPKSFLLQDTSDKMAKAVPPQPLAVAVEKSIPALERGSTRIVAIGDASLWSNRLIDSSANREFAAATVNWLVQQNLLLGDIQRQAIRTYKLTLTNAQMSNARWVLLAGLPGAVLLVGFFVWLRRRT